MSLLLQALQKASKSRDEATAEVSPDAMSLEDELALEPSAPASRGRQEASPPPTSAYAATVVQAGSVPTFDPLDYAREHYMLTFVGLAILVAIAYGTYVYLQVARPFRNFSPGPIPTAASPAPPASLASTPPPSASAKISGMPGGTTAAANTTVVATSGRANESAAAVSEPTTPPTAIATLETSSPRARTMTDTAPEKPARKTAAVARRNTESPELADASDTIETVVVPSSHSRPSGDISVRHEGAAVAAVSPALMQAYETLQRGDNAQAKELYEQVLQAEPRNVDALLGLGAIALNDGRVEDASRYYQSVLELDPRNSYAQAGLISIIGAADVPASESRLKRLISRDPSAFLYFSLGNLYAEQAQWPNAQQAYYQAFQMQPDNPDYAFNLAIGLEHLGQNRLALDYYRKALDLSFKKGHANFDQSLVIQRVGQLSTRIEQ